MTKFSSVFREHYLAIILALLTSFIVVFPQIYFRIDHRNDGVYQGIELLPDSPWSARVREIQDGHGFGSIYYQDGKNNPYLFQPLGSMVAAYLGQAFGLEINNTILLSRFILPFITFLLLYSFVWLFFKDKLFSLSCAALLLLADSALSFSGLSQLFHGLSPDSFLRLARPVNPAMIYILLFGFFLTFWKFYQKRDWRLGVLSTITLGLNFYNYFYSWTYLYAFGGILVLCFVAQKKWREALRVGVVFTGALILLVPYAINLYRATIHPAYHDASLRFGVVASREPLFVGFLVLIALVLFLWKFPKLDREKYFFGLALLLSPIVTMNQQLITGKVLQAAHYHWFFHKPIAIIFILSVVCYFLVQRWPRLKKVFLVFVLLGSVGVAVFVQINSYFFDDRDGGLVALDRQRYGEPMQWLVDHGEENSVVLANDELSHATVIYTPFDVFYHRAAIYSLAATKERLFDVLFTFYRLRGVGADQAKEIFFAERGFISANIYGMHYRELLGSYEAIPDAEIKDITDRYIKTLETPNERWLADIFHRYHVGYIVWDKKTDPLWDLAQYSFLKPSIDFGSIVIYQTI